MNKIIQKSRKNRAKFFIIFFCVFVWLAAFQAALAATPVSGEILTDTIWTKAESPYVVEYYLEVGEGATLSIEPGVIVKFNQSYIDVYGKIIASGTPEDKIYFTSFLDDSVGGDTNGDGGAITPDDGDWQGINFYQPSSGSQFDYADFKYAETNFYLDSSDLILASSSVSFTDYAAIDSYNSNLIVSGSKFEDYYYGIDAAGGTLDLTNNSFNRGEFPVYADYKTDIKNSGNTVENNEYNGIGLYGDSYRINFNKIFYKDIPYILFNDFTINSSSTAVFEPGAIIKTEGWLVRIRAYGKLTAIGTDDDKIIMTSIFDDSVYGDTNPNGGGNIPGIGSWGGIYFGPLSSGSDLENFVIKYSGGLYFDSIDIDLDKIYVENSAGLDVYNGNLKISNSILKNNYEGVDVYKGNAEVADTIFQNNNYGIDVFEGNVKVDNSIITGSHDGIYIYSGDLKINDSIIKNNKYGINASKASLDLRNSSVLDNLDSGVDSWKAEEMNIINNNISGNKFDGIYIDSASTTISGNKIFKNIGKGIRVATSSPVTISGNDIYDNAGFGIYNWVYILYGGAPIDARNNWWGDESGPYHDILNPEGQGDAVSDGVIFTPWLEASIEEPAGFSSVAFIPGIQASRLYRQGLLWENQLWEPNRNGDARKLFMDENGKSLDAGIYTRDIIKETNTPVSTGSLGLNIYKKFSESMDKLVASSTISAWKALPYDWRFDLSDIVGGGVKWADGNISFINQKPEGQLPYMISELEELAENSKNGKVTIITHSNGGLVAKALLKKLVEMKGRGESDLIDKIDRLIMVAAPQLGTPQAITSMLHGDGQELGFGFILSAPVAREFAENMLGAYNLLPSEKYFNTVLNPMIKFDPSIDKVNNWRLSYGDEISDYAEFKNFILGKEGRTKPSSGNISIPNVLNASLLGVSENNHRTLDDWQIPASIEVTQIAGWGLDTVSGVKYLAKEECSPNLSPCVPISVLDHEPIITSDGDKTVVTPSATSVEGEVYYLNINKYNNDDHTPRTHKDIFEIQPLEDFIKNIITNSTSTIPVYITSEKPEPASTDSRLRLSVHSPVSIDIYDSLGNHTGIIPNPDPNSDLELVEENIPNSYYMNFGEGKYVGFDSGSQNKVELNGTGSGTFTLNIGEYSGDIEATSTAFIDIPVTSAMKGELDIENLDTVPQLKIDVEGDGIFDFEIKPSEEFDPILFLEIMKKTIISFGLKKGEEESLINRIDNLIKSIKKGKIGQVEKKLKGFIRNVESRDKYNKKISDEEKQAILNMLNQLLINIK